MILDEEGYEMEHNVSTSEKWWLISDETVAFVRAALSAPTHAANCYNCQDWPPGEGCRGCAGDNLRKVAIHILDNSLRPAPDPSESAVRVISDEEVRNETA